MSASSIACRWQKQNKFRSLSWSENWQNTASVIFRKQGNWTASDCLTICQKQLSLINIILHSIKIHSINITKITYFNKNITLLLLFINVRCIARWLHRCSSNGIRTRAAIVRAKTWQTSIFILQSHLQVDNSEGSECYGVRWVAHQRFSVGTFEGNQKWNWDLPDLVQEIVQVNHMKLLIFRPEECGGNSVEPKTGIELNFFGPLKHFQASTTHWILNLQFGKN